MSAASKSLQLMQGSAGYKDVCRKFEDLVRSPPTRLLPDSASGILGDRVIRSHATEFWLHELQQVLKREGRTCHEMRDLPLFKYSFGEPQTLLQLTLSDKSEGMKEALERLGILTHSVGGLPRKERIFKSARHSLGRHTFDLRHLCNAFNTRQSCESNKLAESDLKDRLARHEVQLKTVATQILESLGHEPPEGFDEAGW